MTGTTRLAPDTALQRLEELGRSSDPSNYIVDGIPPRVALELASPEAVAEALALCAAAGLALVPWGGGGQMGLGNLPERYDVALDLRGLAAVVDYEPDDLTIGVQAGCTLARLAAILSEHGQMLPLDADDPERITIGGLVATGLGCPRRFGYGSLRDLIIGITVALPDGTLARGGGMVVKNVSGYDMMRLHFGALGSLGVIVRANFKLLPSPEAQRTLLVAFPSLEEAMEGALAVRGSQLAPTALVVLAPVTAERFVGMARWTLAARCEGPEGAVLRQAERLAETAASATSEARILEHEETLRFWSSLQGKLAATPLVDVIRVRIGELPSRLGELAARLVTEWGSALEDAVLDVGSGLAFATLAGTVEELRAAWTRLAGYGRHATMLAAPRDVKAGYDVFGRPPEGVAVMRRLKETFDPERTLNPGRFIALL
ncbi:putative FAD-linked oxidoreductase [bacterium HR28]|uniref:FAD-binding oxidoreductase n=1 Tax=Thermomicrobium roseum TaxID=500 RepID=A0A7C1X523_THERO|nr:putative FAD-linked oxidoreductase [bacterium HR28]